MMTLHNRQLLRALCMMITMAILAGCASRGQAPVQERSKKSIANKMRDKDWRPKIYVVQKGDTLYSIAFNHGLDYHEIAELNGIKNPSMISIGQEIRLFAPGAPTTPPALESKPAPANQPAEPPIKDQPVALKLPYSAQAVAQLEKMQQAPSAVLDKAEVKPEIIARNDSTADDDDAMPDWGLPAIGKVVGEFSESANRKGIDIAGKRGQAVMASAPGKVVYSGSGLRGYGKLIIIKHNKTYLSAYAHNDQVLVKEGQNVSKGQKIAEMGNTDTDQVKLHFEIRKLGKPVDPEKLLPLPKP